MYQNRQQSNVRAGKGRLLLVWFFLIAFVVIALAAYVVYFYPLAYSRADTSTSTPVVIQPPVLDIVAYNHKLNDLAHLATTTPLNSSGQASTTKPHLWPVKIVYPNVGALLPFNRIVAYYGNFYSTGM